MHQGGCVDLATEAFQPVIPPIYRQECRDLKGAQLPEVKVTQAPVPEAS